MNKIIIIRKENNILAIWRIYCLLKIMGIIVPILLLIFSYLLGSIPWALIVSKLVAGIDIRDYGSKNMGATNVLRILGFKYGLIVFILDALKAGVVISLFTFGLLDYELDWMVLKIHPIFYGFAALIGHLLPVFANFKGGKGVSCCAGIVLAYNPIIFLGALITFIVVFAISKYISLSSISSGIIAFGMSFIPFSGSIDWIFVIVMGSALIFVIIRHIPNIIRIIKHTEPKTHLVRDKNGHQNK